MNNILIIGAGRSSGDLIDYLGNKSEKNDWQIRLGDYNISLAEERAGKSIFVTPFQLDVSNTENLLKEVTMADIVVSMVPAHMHFPVAKMCVDLGKSMVTASYVSPEVLGLHDKAIDNECLILMECGLDPGLDHMSAMKSIDEIKSKGGKLTLFKSFTGGLVAPENDNMWNYKFTWNPRNVILAGQGVSKFVRNNRFKYISYSKVFSRIEEVFIEGFGDFEAYPNRDSLKYNKIYDLEDIPTLFRGTLRKKGFCEFWDVFVQLGMTDDSYFMTESDTLTSRNFLNSFLPYSGVLSTEEKLISFFDLTKDHLVYRKIDALDFFSDKEINLKGKLTPAMVLLEILLQKWSLSPDDRDMIIMQHQFEYTLNGVKHRRLSSFGMEGDVGNKTAMAKAVGLPVAIAVEEILNGRLKESGVQIPVKKSIYEPILKAIAAEGIFFNEVED